MVNNNDDNDDNDDKDDNNNKDNKLAALAQALGNTSDQDVAMMGLFSFFNLGLKKAIDDGQSEESVKEAGLKILRDLNLEHEYRRIRDLVDATRVNVNSMLDDEDRYGDDTTTII